MILFFNYKKMEIRMKCKIIDLRVVVPIYQYIEFKLWIECINI